MRHFFSFHLEHLNYYSIQSIKLLQSTSGNNLTQILIYIDSNQFHFNNRGSGCVMGELLMDKPVFSGDSEIEQLNLIIELLGTPNDQIWPGK